MAAAASVGSLMALTVAVPLLVMAGTASSDDGGLNSDGLPQPVAEAYQQAADRARSFDPPCEIPPWLLAGIGQVESGHGTYGGATVGPDGDVAPSIVGPALPALGGDTDSGGWDGSAVVDHAVGPMQFIPAAWRRYGLDGNGDGLMNPHNIYDAALSAAAYLCASASPMATEVDWRRGLFAYNRSDAYVAEVLSAATAYRPDPTAGSGMPGASVQLVVVPGIGLMNSSWASQAQAMLTAAARDGVQLTGTSYRSTAEQIALREAHCGTTRYAIYEMPSSQCSPPTARPGTSDHEQGLAIDFHNCSTRRTACYRWLAANAGRFGLHPLNIEPWHWSSGPETSP